MHREKALQESQLVGCLPWVSKEMEIIPQETLLVYASFHGIIYNSNAIPKDKAPKGYEDLIDPVLSPLWAGKMAIPRTFIGWFDCRETGGGRKSWRTPASSRRFPVGGCARVKKSASSAASSRLWRAPAAP